MMAVENNSKLLQKPLKQSAQVNILSEWIASSSQPSTVSMNLLV